MMPHPTESSLTVMLVEDDPDIRAIIELAIGLDPSIGLKLAFNGTLALAILHEETLPPDALLIDAHLPDVSGVDLADTVRRKYGIPVIFLTAAVRPADKDRYAEVGAAGIIAKPFDPLALSGEIRRLLEVSRNNS